MCRDVTDVIIRNLCRAMSASLWACGGTDIGPSAFSVGAYRPIRCKGVASTWTIAILHGSCPDVVHDHHLLACQPICVSVWMPVCLSSFSSTCPLPLFFLCGQHKADMHLKPLSSCLINTWH